MESPDSGKEINEPEHKLPLGKLRVSYTRLQRTLCRIHASTSCQSQMSAVLSLATGFGKSLCLERQTWMV